MLYKNGTYKRKCNIGVIFEITKTIRNDIQEWKTRNNGSWKITRIPPIARSKLRQLVRGWDTENYLNILFIRSRPRGRYISRGSMARRKSKRKRKGRKRTGERGWGLEWPEKGCNKKERRGGRSGRWCLCLEFITQWYHFVPQRSQATPGTNPGRAEPRQSGWHHGILLPVMLKQFPPRVLTLLYKS